MRVSAKFGFLAALAPCLLAILLAAPAARSANDEPDRRANDRNGEAPGPGQLSGGGRGVRPVDIRPRDRFSVTVETDSTIYHVGDQVRVRFRASDDCVVYIFNTDSDGVVRQVFPNYYDRDNAIRGNQDYTIPNRRYWLVTTGPPGRESLQIIAYRRGWRALEPWNEFRSSEPFPRRALSPAEMRQRVDKEARDWEAEQSRGPGDRAGGGLRIVPVPVPRETYAEDWARFQVRGRPPEPYDWRERY